MPANTDSVQYLLEFVANERRQELNIKKEEIKLFLFTDTDFKQKILKTLFINY